MNTQQGYVAKDYTLVPKIIAAIISLILLASVFMPYSTATERYKDLLDYTPDEITQEIYNLDADDMVNLSMVEYAIIYASNSDEFFDDEFTGIFYVAFTGIVALFSLLCFIFALAKKPVIMMILNTMILAVLGIQAFDQSERGNVPSRVYEWGFGFYVSAACVLLIFIFAIWLIIAKIQNKKMPAMPMQAMPYNMPQGYPQAPFNPAQAYQPANAAFDYQNAQFNAPQEYNSFAPTPSRAYQAESYSNSVNAQSAQVSSEWVCSCGYRTSNNFCGNCGAPKRTEPVSWTCVCGKVNTGKFCTNCGNRFNG